MYFEALNVCLVTRLTREGAGQELLTLLVQEDASAGELM